MRLVLFASFLFLFGCTQEDQLRSVSSHPYQVSLKLAAEQVDFGAQSVNSYNNRKVVIHWGGNSQAFRLRWSEMKGPFSWRGGNYPGKGGTCSESISEDCTIVLTYRPTEVKKSADTDLLSLTYFDGEKDKDLSLVLKGRGVANADLRLSLDGIEEIEESFRFPILPVGASAEQTFHILYSGLWPATGVTFRELPAPFSLIENTCAEEVSQNCRVTVRYLSGKAGEFGGELKITYNSGSYADETKASLIGTSRDAARLVVSPVSTTNFGSVPLGASSERVFILTNAGNLPLTALSSKPFPNSDFSYKAGAFPGAGGDCGAVISSLGCRIVVSFAPGKAGLSSDNLGFSYNDGVVSSATSSLTLSGKGEVAGKIVSSLPVLDFGSVPLNQGKDRALTLANPSSSTLSAKMGAVSAPTPYQILSPDTCSNVSLAPGQSCTLTIRFLPTQAGKSSKAFVVPFDGGLGPQTLAVGLEGVGSDGAVLELSAAAIDFGTLLVGESKDSMVSLRYFGGRPAMITRVTLSPGAPFSLKGGSFGASGTCSNSISGNCNFTLSFAPTSTGSFTSSLTIEYLDGLGGTSSVSLTMVGKSGAVAALAFSSGPTHDFGAVSLRDSRQHTFTLTNSGGVAAQGVSLVIPPLPFSRVGGSCSSTPFSLSAGASCTILIRFLPTVAQFFSETMSASFFDGVKNTRSDTQLKGVGDPAALLRFTAASPFDFGNVIVGAEKRSPLQVVKYGSLDAKIVGVDGATGPFSFPGGSFSGGGTCPSGNISATCDLILSFRAAILGSVTGKLTIRYLNGVSAVEQSVSLDLKGTGIASGILSVTPLASLYDFGTLPFGKSKEAIFTVKNSGGAPVTQVALTSSPAEPFFLSGGSCPTSGGISLSVGASCTVRVTFAPLSKHGVRLFSDSVGISFHDGVSLRSSTVSFVGRSTDAALLEIAEGSALSFGPVLLGASLRKTIQLKYYGGRPAQVSSISITGDFAFEGGFPGPGGTCAASSIPSDCLAVITFRPTAVGARAGQFTLSYLDGVEPSARTVSILLGGTGEEPALLSLLPAMSPFDFGNVSFGQVKTQRFTLRNSTLTTRNATGLTFVAPLPPFRYQHNCPALLAPGASCFLDVDFAPLATGLVGGFSGQFEVRYFNGVSNSTLVQRLQGQSDDRALLVFETSAFDFGSHVLGKRSATLLRLKYFGGRAAKIQQVLGASSAFAFSGGAFPGGGDCSMTPATDCTLGIEFVPTTKGPVSQDLTVRYDDGYGTIKDAKIHLQGSGLAPARLIGGSTDFGVVLVGASAERTVTISRAGDVSATAMTSLLLPGPFQFKGSAYPGTGGTCGVSLSGSSCTLVLSYRPTVEKVDAATLTLSYHDGVGLQALALSLAGTGRTTAVLSLSAENGPTFADYLVGSGAPPLKKKITVTNGGTGDASQITLGNPTEYFSILSDGCSGLAKLSMGGSCAVVVQYEPRVSGKHEWLFTVGYQSGALGLKSTSLNLSGRGTQWVQLAAGGNHSCAITSTGDLKCWGRNDKGQLGLGDKVNRGFQAGQMGASLLPVNLGTQRRASRVFVGYWHTCVILENGAVKCWGENSYGQLGLGDTRARGGIPQDMGSNLSEVSLGTGRTAVDLALGISHSCAILDDGNVKCWGLNLQGQLGLGDTVNRGVAPSQMGDALSPVDLAGEKVVRLSANAGHTCALVESGRLKCWGSNYSAQLGLPDIGEVRGDEPGEMGAALSFVDVGSARKVREVTAGGGFTCVILDDANVKCWGRNDGSGNLGRLWCQNTSGAVGPCSDSRYDLPAETYGSLSGQMGDGLPTVDLNGARALQIRSGNLHTCVLFEDKSVRCWGANESGQLGLGDTLSRGDTPQRMGSNLPSVNLGSPFPSVGIALGGDHTCAVSSAGPIKCWGGNRYGNLGYGDVLPRGDEPSEMGAALPEVSLY